MPRSRSSDNAVVPAAGTTSNNVPIPNNASLIGFSTPGTLVSTTIKFGLGFNDTDTPKTLKKSDGTDFSVTVTTNKWYGFTDQERALFEGAKYIQLQMGSSETGGATITLYFGQLQ